MVEEKVPNFTHRIEAIFADKMKNMIFQIG